MREQDLSGARADAIAGVPTGRTFTYLSGRSRKILRARSDAGVMQYLTALAEFAGLDVEWFLDGRESPEVATVSGQEIPVIAFLPSVPREGVIIDKVRGVRPVCSPDADYYRMAEDRKPYLWRNDDLLIDPHGAQSSSSIALIADVDTGQVDAYRIKRAGGELVLETLSDDQAPAPAKWRVIGTTIKVRRKLASGLVVSFESDTGLTPEMLLI